MESMSRLTVLNGPVELFEHPHAIEMAKVWRSYFEAVASGQLSEEDRKAFLQTVELLNSTCQIVCRMPLHAVY